MEFSRQKYWSSLLFLLQGIFLTQGPNLRSVISICCYLHVWGSSASKLEYSRECSFAGLPMRTQLRSHSNVLFQSSLTLLISNVKSLWIQNPCYHENHVRAEMAVRSDVHPSSCDQQSTCCCQVAIKLPSSMCWLSSAQVNLSCLDTYSDDWHHHWCGAGWWWWVSLLLAADFWYHHGWLRCLTCVQYINVLLM